MDTVSIRSSMDSGELRLGPVRPSGDAEWYRASLSGPVVNGAVEVRDRLQLAEIAAATERLFGVGTPDRVTIVTWPGPRSG